MKFKYLDYLTCPCCEGEIEEIRTSRFHFDDEDKFEYFQCCRCKNKYYKCEYEIIDEGKKIKYKLLEECSF